MVVRKAGKLRVQGCEFRVWGLENAGMVLEVGCGVLHNGMKIAIRINLFPTRK